ncbi:MAG: hypothetical protein IH941_09970 [Acidobacteria bacterium]|nr:hypothetical protein [Acidobacteriota bacterium]
MNALIPELQQKNVEAIVVLLHEGGFSDGDKDVTVGMDSPVRSPRSFRHSTTPWIW